MENSPAMPEKFFVEALQRHAKVLVFRFGPEDLGWPCRRRRLYCVALAYESMAWVGPDGDGDEPLQHFLSLFRRKVITDAGIFRGCDTAAAIESTLHLRGKMAGMSPEAVADAPLADFVRTPKLKAFASKYLGFIS
eukprot:9817169-Lingulodinium_polyedra.AAC.1